MNKGYKISVIGAGSWGTALAMLLCNSGHKVSLWGHKLGHVEDMIKEKENVKYLPGVKVPNALHITNSIDDCISDTNLIVMVVPSHGLRKVFARIAKSIMPNSVIISAVKGIENDSLLTMSQVIAEVLKNFNIDREIEVGVLSGPSFAQEVAKEVPTAVTIGFSSLETAKKMQQVFGTENFRIYASKDVIGLEISASYKNIIAIATGVCDGLGYGLNTRAALITRGLAEMQRLGVGLKADATTFSGLSGLGDLILTCTGDLSRNRTVGIKLGEGKNIDDITAEMSMVAEGVKTTKSIYDLKNSLKIETPILDQVYNIIYRQKDCSEAVKDLLGRDMKVE